MNDSAHKKAKRIIHIFKQYCDYTLLDYVNIPKDRLNKLIHEMKLMEEDINNLIISNNRLSTDLLTLEANALERIRQLEEKIKEKSL